MDTKIIKLQDIVGFLNAMCALVPSLAKSIIKNIEFEKDSSYNCLSLINEMIRYTQERYTCNNCQNYLNFYKINYDEKTNIFSIEDIRENEPNIIKLSERKQT